VADVSTRRRRALELFAPLGPTYDRYARLLSLGQDPGWRRFLVKCVEARPGDTISGESHAWVEAWLGEWWAFDPTNGVPVGERHALVGRGRDYADVPPLKGVHSAGTPDALEVEVRITRLA